MAGEVTNSTSLANRLLGKLADGALKSGRPVVAIDTTSFATGELDAADVRLLNIEVPSNGIHQSVAVYTADLDSHATPTLEIDVGLYMANSASTITSSTVTRHLALAVLDADALVDGSAVCQSATTSYVVQAAPTATFAPADGGQEYWQILGYDVDPQCRFLIGVKSTAASATLAAGSLSLRVEYLVP